MEKSGLNSYDDLKKFMQDKPLLYELEISHHCWTCEATEHNPDCKITCTPAEVKDGFITNIAYIQSSDPKKDIDFIKKHSLVKRVEVFILTPKMAMVKIVSKYNAMAIHVLHKYKSGHVDQTVTHSGTDKIMVLSPTFNDMKDIIGEMSEHKDYDVKLRSKTFLHEPELNGLATFKTSGFLEMKVAKGMLTEKQFDIFERACNAGYYDTPKKITLDELAVHLGIDKATVAEHLRKAESKLMPLFLKVMKKM